ncbi:unnamed protein product [Timema podura]|uniref:Uncharacterized protein n=1 Tax=Timema podura TaxID=61482 RepID=A0ABN7PLR0_TIMPD|nr:unnamed protein product [Timema podura]
MALKRRCDANKTQVPTTQCTRYLLTIHTFTEKRDERVSQALVIDLQVLTCCYKRYLVLDLQVLTYCYKRYLVLDLQVLWAAQMG